MATVQEPIQLQYKDLIDIALGSTDIGLFNLHLLHTILQCLVVQLNLDGSIIEYNGTQRGNIEHFFANRTSVAKQTSIEKVEPTTTTDLEEQNPQVNLVVKDLENDELLCGNPGVPGKMVSRSVPKCKELLDSLKCSTGGKENPLGKMVDLINLTERMTAAEIAIEKISSIIYDVTKKNQEMADLLNEKNTQLASLLDRLEFIEHETNINVDGDQFPNDDDSTRDDSQAKGGTNGTRSDGASRTTGGGVSAATGGGSTATGGGGSVGTVGGGSAATGGAESGTTGGAARETGTAGGVDATDGGAGATDGGAGAIAGGVGKIDGGAGAIAGGVGKTDGGGATAPDGSAKAQGGTGKRFSGTASAGIRPEKETTGGTGGVFASEDDKKPGGLSGSNMLHSTGGAPHKTDQLISNIPGEGMLKDDSVVQIFIRSQSKDLDRIMDQKQDDLLKKLEDSFMCAGGIVTGKMLKHSERELLRKFHLFKSMIFERLIAVECDLSRTQKQVKHIDDSVEDLLDLYSRISKKISHFDEFEKTANELFVIIQKNIHCLMGEREVRRRQIYDIIESIEMVKSIKANQEDLDLLEVRKADKCYVDSKVSIKKFNVIQNDLACSIIQTMEKNSTQDIEMVNAVKRIESIIEGKINRCDHNYAIATITKRIDEVSDKLNKMIKLRVCPEGAGTVQMLKNVRCITCNDVCQMKMEESTTLSRTAILKTKHQVALQVETECRTGTKPKLTEIIRSRYCGGEYTTVEPSERVPQKTDFYIDASVCPPPMDDVYYIEGNDGALYRAQPPPACPNTNSGHLIRRKPSK